MCRESIGRCCHDEIRPWYSRAAEYLLCGSGPFVLPYCKPLTAGLRLDGLERWSRNTRVIQEHRERLLASDTIKISLNSTVTGFALSAKTAVGSRA